jgi:F420-0:gamma-glutamyl ligase-like protein
MNVKFPNNTSKWQNEFNSAFKGLRRICKTTTNFVKDGNNDIIAGRYYISSVPGSVAGIATGYGLDGPVIGSR